MVFLMISTFIFKRHILS